MEVTKEVIDAQARHNKGQELGVSDQVYLNALPTDLADALQEAYDHLEYCQYGDSRERKCAVEGNLREKLEAALKKAGRRT